MRRELVIERAAGALWACRVEDERVVELALERDAPLQPETILRARLGEIAPQSEAAFLDLGEGRSGFLAADDVPAGGAGKTAPIGKRLEAGQYCTVQIKAAAASPEKAQPVTAKPALSGRYVVLQPGGRGLAMPPGGLEERHGEALKADLAAIAERARLQLRSAAAVGEGPAIRAEAESLLERARALQAPGNTIGTLLSPPSSLTRLLREAPAAPARIHLSEAALMAEAAPLAERWSDLAAALTLWAEPVSAFEAFGGDAALEAVEAGRLDLPSGGAITLDETRAGAVIDVDAGATGAGGNAATARRKTNREAAAAAARLLRLANCGGLAVIDFLDMKARRDREDVLAALDEALAGERGRVHRSGMNAHGLVSLTRPRRGQPLRERLLAPRPARASLEARGLALLRRAERESAGDKRPGELVLELDGELAAWLTAQGSLRELQQRTGRRVRLDEARKQGEMAETARIEAR